MDTPTAPATDWQKPEVGNRRSHILGAATVAVSLLAVAAGAWGLSNADAAGAGGRGQAGPPGMSQFGPGQPPTTGQSLDRDLAAMLFTTDGRVNEELLKEFLSRLPGGLEQFLQIAVRNDELTQAQAEALRSAATNSEEPQ